MGVPSLDTVGAMRDFVERHDLQDLPHAADVDGEVWKANGIVGQPAWVFIDGETGEQAQHLGSLGEQGLTEVVEQLTS